MSPVRLLVERSAPVSCLVAALACGAAAGLAPGDALATGMQGHIYMAQCGAEQAQEPRLKALFAAQPLSLANGAFFPDSGYTAPDHDQGEIAHWEQYIQGYLEIIRERYSPPYDDPEAARHVAVMLGAAAHGITDSTFDALLYERSEQVDPGGVDDLDLSMDVFLVAQLKREFVPMVDVDPQTLADVYVQKVPHDVLPAAISKAMTTARSGIAGTIFLAKAPDSFVKRHPWASASFLDARTPGGYPFGAKVVARYHEEILRRLDGDNSAESIVIGTYPSAELPLVTLDSTRPDGRVVLFFGHGLDRDSIDAKTTLVLLGPDGQQIEAEASIFRGDKWPNVLTLRPAAPWAPGASYKAVLRNTIKTLNGVSPSKDYELSFTTCTPDPATGDCPLPTGPRPPSACPLNDARYVVVDEPEGEGGAAGAPAGSPGGGGTGGEASAGASSGNGGGAPAPSGAAEPAASDDGGCSVNAARARGSALPALLALAAAIAAIAARRRSRG
jgi:hypothetical protein